MARIAYILLCHKDPEGIIRQVQELTAAGDAVAIHFDAGAAPEAFRRLTDALSGNRGVTFVRRRIRCGWGEWSLVRATLNALEAALAAFADATHFYMLSGDCMPIKPAEHAHAVLDAEQADYIESYDFFTSGWIKTGLREERLIYRHYFNERSSKRLFYAALEAQRRLGLRRAIPADIEVMIGSQWWCLRRATVEAVMGFCRKRPDVVRFFATTWIPDETFFQTLVRHLVPATEIRNRTLTFLMFSDYGMPVTFYNDQHDFLLAQDFLFARKISTEATALKASLGALYAQTGRSFAASGGGRRLYSFLTSRGREGRRFAQRYWERDSTIGHDRELLILVCKKWHVGRRLSGRIRDAVGVSEMSYLFDEQDTQLPYLGGIEATLEKRARHRRALMRMLFDYHDTDRLLLCVDPANLDTLTDFRADPCITRIAEIQCDFSDDYLAGHAVRLGVIGADAPDALLRQLLPALREDIRQESDRLRNTEFAHFHRIRELDTPGRNAASLAGFLDIPHDQAPDIATTDHLFAD